MKYLRTERVVRRAQRGDEQVIRFLSFMLMFQGKRVALVSGEVHTVAPHPLSNSTALVANASTMET